MALAAFSVATISLVCAADDTARVSAGDLISQVISGQNFSGTELRVSGVALSKTSAGSGLVNLGSQATYRSGVYENFVSVYDVPVNISQGSSVELLVTVEESSAVKLGERIFVTIETSFLRCIKC